MSLNKFSRTLTQEITNPAAKAMLYGIGLTSEDMNKAQIGIASTGYEGNPCNMHLNGLSVHVKKGIQENGMVGLIFHTIGVSDGMTNGNDGMSYSLPSRDIIADSIENVVGAQWYDGVIAVVGCDKNMPGAMMALARLNRPGMLVYGGTIRSGTYKGEKLDIVSAFEALGKKYAGTISDEDYEAYFDREDNPYDTEFVQSIPGKLEIHGNQVYYDKSDKDIMKIMMGIFPNDFRNGVRIRE